MVTSPETAAPPELPGDPFSPEVPALLQRHLDHLLASAIDLEVVRERGYRPVLLGNPQVPLFITGGGEKRETPWPAGELAP